MITEIQLDSLVRAIQEGRVKLTQVPKELKEAVNKRLNEANKER